MPLTDKTKLWALATVRTTVNGKFLLDNQGSSGGLTAHDTFDELVEALRMCCFQWESKPENANEETTETNPV